MHAPGQRITTTAKPAIVLSVLVPCFFAGTVLAFDGGRQPYGSVAQLPESGHRAQRLDPGNALDGVGLRLPSARRPHAATLTETGDGIFDTLEPVGNSVFYAGSRETMRYGLRSTEAFRGIYSRLSAAWSSQIQTGITQSADLTPVRSIAGQLQTILSPGWGLNLGLRYSMGDAYRPGSSPYSGNAYPETNAGNLPIWHSGRAAATGLMNYHLQLNYHYGTRNTFGLGFSSGRETDALLTRGLPLDDARQFNLSGNHWLNPDWALNYGIVSSELNRRQGLHLGLRYLF